MKKVNYLAPKVRVVKLASRMALLQSSDPESGTFNPGTGTGGGGL